MDDNLGSDSGGGIIKNLKNKIPMNTTTLKLEPAIALSEGQFFSLCQQNPELKFERSPQGELIIMPPTGGETGRKNATLIARFVIWNETYDLGVVFDSSTCFRLPIDLSEK